MPTSRKRKNRGKGAGAKERRRRVQQHNDAMRERIRANEGGAFDEALIGLAALGALNRKGVKRYIA
jgi:hypothetical protein